MFNIMKSILILGGIIKNCNLIIVLMGLCLFLSMSCVMAGDVNETGNFTQLDALIDDADESVNLTGDYASVDGDAEVTISKSVNVTGNGHSIDNSKSPIVFDGNDSNVVFENVKFLGDMFRASDNATNLNVTFINCSLPVKSHLSYLVVIPQYELGTTGEISSNVVSLAKSIVGKSVGLEAAKKLAKWVGKNINHETAPGFYQTPDTTLKRKLGNCCSQTDLFLQMCVAVGINKSHKLYFVHVGTIVFGDRHFFAMIDGILVDVDARPNSPWGHARIGDRGIYKVTEYPYLPLPRQY